VLIGDAPWASRPPGKSLRDHAGKKQALKKGTQYRIAHPADLLAAKDWSAWQHECFRAERLQPFKQVFRELYVVTKQEAADAGGSSRYAGQQVNEKQALALWASVGGTRRMASSRSFTTRKSPPASSFGMAAERQWKSKANAG